MEKNITKLSADELSTMSVSQMLKLVEEYDRAKGTSHGQELWEKVEETEYQGMMQATVEQGADEVLQKLQERGFILTVLTNNSRKTADTVLQRFGLVDFFEQVATRDEVEELKPHPRRNTTHKKSICKQSKQDLLHWRQLDRW
ncbi:MAG: HAD family hydrolase [Bacillota bacterium]